MTTVRDQDVETSSGGRVGSETRSRRPRVDPDDGFEDAFDELFPRAVRLASRLLGDRAAAEDVAAEAMARAGPWRCVTWADCPTGRWPRLSEFPSAA